MHSANSSGLGNRLNSACVALALSKEDEVGLDWPSTKDLDCPRTQIFSHPRLVEGKKEGPRISIGNPWLPHHLQTLRRRWKIDGAGHIFREEMANAASDITWSQEVQDDMLELPEKFVAIHARLSIHRKITLNNRGRPVALYHRWGRASGQLEAAYESARAFGLPIFYAGDLPISHEVLRDEEGIFTNDNLRDAQDLSGRQGKAVIRAASDMATLCKANAIVACGVPSSFRNISALCGVPILRRALI